MKRGEIYFVTLDPVLGREQNGRRPVLVVSIDAINSAPLVVTVVPGTEGANVRRDVGAPPVSFVALICARPNERTTHRVVRTVGF